MAHLLLIMESDAALRAEFRRRAALRFSQMSGLQVESLAVGHCVVFRACQQQAPGDSLLSESRCALLLGYALNDSGQWLNAAQYFSEWQDGRMPPAHDGYFVGVRYDVDRGLTVEVDPWGLFPLYYTRIGSTLIAGSSADFFDCHPRFVARIDPAGLAGILLTNGLVGGRTLIGGVKQLDCGHILLSDSSGSPREIEVFRPPEAVPREQETDDRILEETHHAVRQAILRHCPRGEATALMLSGGLDSRLMAGYLRQLDINTSALTLGRSTDYEVQAAGRVATSLNLPSVVLSDQPERSVVPELARTLAREQHLSGGFSNLEFGGNHSGPGEFAPFFWSGFFVDDLLGGCGVWFGFDGPSEQWSCNTFLRKLHGWGVAPDDCRTLLNLPYREADRVVQDCVDRLHGEWDRLPGSPAQRSLLFKGRTRMRYHIAAAVHRMSFFSWPLLPLLDRRFVELMLRTPAAVVRNCRLQNRLLITQFPELARIPLDTNSFRFLPPEAQVRQNPRLLERVITSGHKRWNALYWKYWKRVEPRRYFRTFDLNGEVWRQVRQAAEPWRTSLDPWLVRSQVDRIVPAPGVDIQLKNRFQHGTPIRTLLGLMLWCSAETGAAARAA